MNVQVIGISTNKNNNTIDNLTPNERKYTADELNQMWDKACDLADEDVSKRSFNSEADEDKEYCILVDRYYYKLVSKEIPFTFE